MAAGALQPRLDGGADADGLVDRSRLTRWAEEDAAAADEEADCCCCCCCDWPSSPSEVRSIGELVGAARAEAAAAAARSCRGPSSSEEEVRSTASELLQRLFLNTS